MCKLLSLGIGCDVELLCQGATTYDGVCAPAATAASKCVVSGAETEIVAGQPASLRITRFDRYSSLLLR